jgi:ELWxxDGT repeat protein
MERARRRSGWLLAAMLSLACSEPRRYPDPPRYSVGGLASGLTATGLVLQNNGGDDLRVDAEGSFAFSNRLLAGGEYRVTVKAQPDGQRCDVTGGEGTMPAADVVSVAVTCHDRAIYFSAADGTTLPQLWRTDGTGTGTVLVAEGLVGVDLAGLSVLGSGLYFSGGGGTGTLWKTDGTAAGTVLVNGVEPLSPLVACGGRGFFSGRTGGNDVEPWETDGAAAGTTEVADVMAGPYGSWPVMLGCLGDVVLFSADDGVHGKELWRTDGTAAGTALVKDIFPGPTSGIVPRWAEPVVFAGELYFTAIDPDHGVELWKTDGTAAGTVLVKDVNPGASNSYILSGHAVFGGALYFVGDDGVHGPELWRTDGTSTGTVLVKDINSGSVGSYPSAFAAFGGALYFSAMDDVNGTELWKTDGTAAGTVLVADICPGACSSAPSALVATASALFFAADDGIHGIEPWRSDGTVAGTALLKDLAVGAQASSPYGFTPVRGRVVFGAATGATGVQLWETDGTEAGTSPLSQLCQGSGCAGLGNFTVF